MFKGSKIDTFWKIRDFSKDNDLKEVAPQEAATDQWEFIGWKGHVQQPLGLRQLYLKSARAIDYGGFRCQEQRRAKEWKEWKEIIGPRDCPE